MLFDESKFATKKELFDFLVKNKDKLIAHKKAVIKHADSFEYDATFVYKGAEKANNPVDLKDKNSLNVLVVINTTNFMDSHKDVHIPGLWDKTLEENKFMMHLQEHQMRFDKIISDGNDLKAFTKKYSWSELGYEFNGKTEGLTFDSVIKRSRNEFMFEQYGAGYVRNHSVGMKYIQLVMCINNDNYGAEFEAWEKYFPMVVNKDTAEESGYFWAVKEAKAIEGSAVPRGSNIVTPTLDNNKFEPVKTTQDEPSKDTQKIDYSKVIAGVKNIKV